MDYFTRYKKNLVITRYFIFSDTFPSLWQIAKDVNEQGLQNCVTYSRIVCLKSVPQNAPSWSRGSRAMADLVVILFTLDSLCGPVSNKCMAKSKHDIPRYAVKAWRANNQTGTMYIRTQGCNRGKSHWRSDFLGRFKQKAFSKLLCISQYSVRVSWPWGKDGIRVLGESQAVAHY